MADDRLALAIDRLRRPVASVPPDDLLQRLQALLPKAAAHLSWIRASVGTEVRLVAVDDVCYFQAADKYTATIDQPSLTQPVLVDTSTTVVDAKQDRSD